MINVLIATSTNKSLVISEGSIPSTAFFAAFIATNNNGIITGKLNTGISKLPLPDFDAMEASSVNVDENPIAPKPMISKK